MQTASIIGCDEVGRGPIAGPVVACAVRLDDQNKNLLRHFKKLGVFDSKKLASDKRQEILDRLGIDPRSLELNKIYSMSHKGYQWSFALADHSPEEIDRINILQASLSCMKRCVDLLIKGFDCHVLVDGNRGFDLAPVGPPFGADMTRPIGPLVEAVVKGDSKFLVISLASIIAKEFRDEKMRALDLIYPGYGLHRHVGYPTEEHRTALQRLGVASIHRKSFKGVKELVEEGTDERLEQGTSSFAKIQE